MSCLIQKPNRVTLTLMLDSLLRKSRHMIVASLWNQYVIYTEEVALFHPEYSPVGFVEWVQAVHLENPPLPEGQTVVLDIQRTETEDWLQRELESLEIPTWRDVPTGDLALDSEESISRIKRFGKYE